MAKTYTSTVTLACWKEHTCAACGSIFSYDFARKVKGTGNTADRASKNAQANVKKTLETVVDPHPCPTCGLYQPDMVGQRRAKSHLKIFWLALVVLATLLILRATDAFQANDATTYFAGAALLVALLHWFVDLRNPNSDPDANRRLATERVSSGAIHHTPGKGRAAGNEIGAPPRSLKDQLGLILLLVAVPLVAAPEIFRNTQRWPLNRDSYPPVAGPGDSTSVYMSEKITSIKGYWRGSPTASLRSSPEAEPVTLAATTKQNDWGSSISVKSSEKADHSTPWITLTLPDDRALAGKTVDCTIDMEVTYPHDTGNSSFETLTQAMHRDVSLKLAPAHAGATYNKIWWSATAWGIAFILTAGQLLRSAGRNLQKLAKPTRILNAS